MAENSAAGRERSGAERPEQFVANPGTSLISPKVIQFAIAYAVLLMGVRVGIELLKIVHPIDLPLFSDFVCFWTAGHVFWTGEAAEVYDYQSLTALQAQLFNHDGLPFFYPPTWLLIVFPFALLPYQVAAILFQVLCVAVAAGACAYLARSRSAGWMVFAFPAMIFGIMIGQNSLLNVALFGGCLAALDRHRPVLAGILIGLMAYKPQIGLLIPFAFLAGREYRAFLAAAAATLLTAGASAVVFGIGAWVAFFDAILFANSWLMAGETAAYKYASMLGWLRQFGIGNGLGYPVQIGFSVLSLAAVLWTWSRDVPVAVKGAVLVSATCLATPYLLDYDLALLAIPLLLIVRLGLTGGFLPYERLAILIAGLSLLFTSGWGVKMDVTAIGAAPLIFMGLSMRRAFWHLKQKPSAT